MLGNPLLLGDDGYQISRSVRIRGSASAYFNRTPASAGNRKTWTWSAWVKRGLLSSTDQYNLFTCWSANNDTAFLQLAIYQDKIFVGGWLTNFLISTPVYRDPSAWYHVVITLDTTQATASNRLRVYINGVEVTAWATDSRSSITQNSDMGINQAAEHNIGRRVPAAYYFDGYLTEINFIDGLNPNTTTRTVGGVTETVLSELGQFDIVTGVWKPAPWTRSFGTNGFYLNFSDPSAATAAAIGKDYSGNGNNWTPNNITLSPTTSTSYDSMLDVPTPWADGGNGRGNYSTLNPLDSFASGVSNGNLTFANGAGLSYKGISTFVIEDIAASQKYYVEYVSDVSYLTGIVTTANSGAASNTSYSDIRGYYSNGNKYSGTTATAYGASFTASDQLAMLVGNGQIEFFKNNVSQGVAFTGLTGAWKVCTVAFGSAGSGVSYNFGQRPFAYTPPSGFRALNTFNLPTPTIARGNLYMDATTYTGNGSARSITGTPFQPDLVWIKGRSGATDHALYDAVRGVQLDLVSNSTAAETTQSTGLTAFNSDGFSIGTLAKLNTNTATYVGWQWKEGATQGFDIVTYTGTRTTSGTVAINHNLGVAPKLVISKSRNNAGVDSGAWFVWTSVLATDNYLRLNTTAAAASISSGGGGTMIAPTGSVFYTPWISGSNINANNYVAYLFAEVAGFSRIGSYTGNGSTDGPFVFCGFRPRWIMIKRTDTTGSWYVVDTARDSFNVMSNDLFPNQSAAENVFATADAVANGFKLRNSGVDMNASGGAYIFAAFAENPFKYSLAR